MNIVIDSVKSYKILMIGWILGWGLMSFLLFSLFPFFKDSISSYAEILTTMPEGVSAAFALDTETIGKAEGFFSTEMLSLYMISTLSLNAYIIITFLSDDNLLVLLLRPVSKLKVFLDLSIAATILLLIGNIAFYAFSILGNLVFVDDPVNYDFYLKSFIGVTLMGLTFTFLLALLRLFASRGLALIVTFIYPITAMIISGLSTIDSMPGFVKYLSIFYYVDHIEIVLNNTLDLGNILILLIVAFISLLLGAIKFNKRYFE